MAKDKGTADLFARRASKREKDSQAEGYFAASEGRANRTSSSRIVSVPLSQILPDRFQPRPILPLDLKEAYYSGDADWRETAQTWLGRADTDPGVQSRVDTLLELGGTFGEHGQIKPVTGVWEEVGGEIRFHLETGERRFWAKALNAVKEGAAAEPHLECREIDTQRRSRERQVVENIHAEKPTAVARAREISSLILSKLDLPDELSLDTEPVPAEHEYYRSVLDLEGAIGQKQMPAGIWEEVGEVMGLSRTAMVRHLNILELPNELQYLADLHRLNERVLREVLSLPREHWEKTLTLAIKEDFTAQDVRAFGERLSGKKSKTVKRQSRSPVEKTATRVRSFLKIAGGEELRGKLGEVATEYAAGLENEEILEAADILQALAEKLRLRAGE